MRLRPVLLLLLATLSAIPLSGCSRKAEKLVGAGRVIRGPGGLGTTVRFIDTPDRDTYVDPGGLGSSDVLFVGWQDAVESRTFLGVSAWNFPDSLVNFQVDSVYLLLGHDLSFGSGSPNVSVYQTSSFDSAAGWPGPSAATLLGSKVDLMSTGEFSIPLNASALGLISGWAHDSTTTGFVLEVPTGLGFVAYRSGTVRFQVVYSYTGGQGTSFTSVTRDYFLRSPSTSTAASGTIIMGGFAKSGLAVRFPVDSIPAGASLDEASVVLNLLSGSATPSPADSSTTVEVRRIRAVWDESVSLKANLAVQDSLTVTGLVRSYQAGSRRLVVQIPGSILREWSATPSSNEGLYISLRDALHRDREYQEYRIGSRESSQPPELHVTYTPLPPGRF